MKSICVISSNSKSLQMFRGHLIREFIKKGNHVMCLAPRDEDFQSVETWLKENGAVLQSISINNTSLNPIQDLASLFSIFRILRKQKPIMIFSYGIKPVIYGSLAAYFAGRPEIMSLITGLGNCFMEENEGKFINKFVRFLYRISLRFNRIVFFQNEDDASTFLKYSITSKNKIRVINGSGVDIEYFSKITPAQSPIRFLFIGRLIKQKGIMEFIEASTHLKKKYPEVIFSVVGGLSPNPSSLSKQQLEDLKQSQAIEYLGEVEDVRDILKQSTVFVLPSYREGTSRACLEAMSSGLPVITTDVPGCRQTVQERKNGFLVPARCSASLEKCMEKFLLKPYLVIQMGQQSRKIAEEKFAVHKVNDAIMKQIQ